jgi:hypothetical protein
MLQVAWNHDGGIVVSKAYGLYLGARAKLNREGPPGWAEHPLRTSGLEIKLNGENMERNSSGALRAPVVVS